MRFIIIGLILLIAATAMADQRIPFICSAGGYWSAVVVVDQAGECPTVIIRDQQGMEVERHFLMSPGQTIIPIPDDVVGWVDVECEECQAVGFVGDDRGVTSVGVVLDRLNGLRVTCPPSKKER